MLVQAILDTALFYLNDTQKTLYTYATMYEPVRIASRELNKILIAHGCEPNKVKSTAIPVPQSTTNPQTLSLPADFFLPIRMFERLQNATNDEWEPMVEQEWESETAVQTAYLRFWAFRNNAIYMIGSTGNREVLLEYFGQFTAISTENTTVDLPMAQDYLAAKTAELCARYIGMNSSFAELIAERDTKPQYESLTDILVQNMQGLPARRRKFTVQRLAVR